MRVLIINSGLSVGGAERLVTNLADHIAKAGHEVVLVYLYGKAELLPNDDRVRVVRIGLTKNFLSLLRTITRLSRLVRQFRPDVVNSHLVHANLLMRVLRLIVPMPRLISSWHTSNDEGRLRIVACRLTDKLADISTNVSNEAVKAFEAQKAVIPGRMIAIHSGIDTEVFSYDENARRAIHSELDLDDAVPTLLAVGRFTEAKDYPNLLHAFAKLVLKGIDAQLLIAGDGPLRKSTECLATELGVIHRVCFLGIRRDIPALMSACDIFVLSSAWEGLPLVVAEAMACQRIVVATDAGGTWEWFEDSGFVVKTGDVKVLAAAIEGAIALPAREKKRLGELGRKRIERFFSIEAVAARWVQMYQGKLPLD